MSPETQTPDAPAAPAWPPLLFHERRVLGVLVEKAKTTPDVYPLSLNSLVTGCNQKSNRDPICDLTDLDVEEALVGAQKKGLVIKITGGRVERWRHNLYDAWKADKVELAVLAELLLRGPQTEGELRARASRMEPIDDLEGLRVGLRRLVERRLAVYLGPEGRRGTTVTHGFHEPEELKHLRARHAAEDAGLPAPTPPARPVPPDAAPGLESRLTAAQGEIADLRKAMAELQATVADLAGQFRELKGALGA
jgi:uncharacterized protein YceH (UPF0502 family)